MPHISRQAREDAARAAQLAAYWDDLGAAGPASADAVAPELASAVQRLRQLDAREDYLSPDPAFGLRLTNELLGQTGAAGVTRNGAHPRGWMNARNLPRRKSTPRGERPGNRNG